MHKLLTKLKAYPISGIMLLAAFFASIEFISTSCTYTTCEAFQDQNFDEWFPYQKTQEFYFSNAKSETDTIKIYGVQKSPEYETGSFESKGCYIHADIYSQNNELTVTAEKVEKATFVSISLFFTSLRSLSFGSSGFAKSNNDVNVENLSSVSLLGRTFSNAQKLEIDTVSFPQATINKLWIAKDIGIVGFEKRDHELWVKQ